MIPKTHEQAAAGPCPAPAMADASPRFQALDPNAAQLMAACADDDFLAGLLRQLVRFGSRGGDGDDVFMTSIVKGIKPRDQLEILLAAQMAAVHVATMTSAQRLARADNMLMQDSAERAFNKLARTFATQMEALKRYRTGAEQKVVQHVSISDGGQAIVGNVTQAPREIAANGAASRT
jgi:hypothetical protein